ncbi:MAG: hypothetical protein Q8L78_07270 [Coxiellaceae bacterium]|nr:hypothetical protein [Coxiellaceae bacterium]
MSFVVIALSFALQWFLNLSSGPYQKPWAPQYVAWMKKRFSSLMQGHGVFTVLILVLPILIVMSLFFTLVYHLFGHFGYLIFSLLLFWYCVDITELRVRSKSELSAEQFLLHSYQKIFSPLLWYFVTGPVGLTLSVVIGLFEKEFQGQKYFVLASQVVDWVPVRLLGLTFALAGNFGTVFKLWIKNLMRGLADEKEMVLVMAKEALGVDKMLLLSDVIGLIHRTVLIWLVLIALLSISGWIG